MVLFFSVTGTKSLDGKMFACLKCNTTKIIYDSKAKKV
jgi:hypothetical protein